MRKQSQLRVNVLFASTASLFLGLTADLPYSEAAPAVSGTAGCVSGVGATVGRNVRIPAAGGSENEFRMDTCGGSPSTGNGWIQRNFVDATEINSAFSQQETYINNLNQQTRNDITQYVDQRVNNAGVDLGPVWNEIRSNTSLIVGVQGAVSTVTQQALALENRATAVEAKNVTQDGRLDGLESRATAGETKNVAQDGRLDGLEGRATATETKNVAQDGRLDSLESRAAASDQKNVEQDARLDDHDKKFADLKGDTEQKNDDQDARLDDHEERISAGERKDAEQDARLDDHEERISAGERKDVEQDARLDDHDNRIGDLETGVGKLVDNAVTYDVDENGNKKGGLTLNDGTGKEVQLGNVAAGKAGTDAVNVDQLKGATDALGGGAKVNEDGTVTAPQYNVGGVNYNNVGDALKATNDLGVQYVADENGKPTNTIRLTGDGTGPVKMTNVAAGTEDSDAVNYGQVKDNISYDRNSDGSRSNSVTLTGGSPGAVALHNVADGKADSDAATVRQVSKARQEAQDYTDSRISELTNDSHQQFSALSGEISKTRQESRAGIAGAMAASALRYDPRPGKLSIAGGMGGFKSTTSIATGIGYTSLDGDWRINAAVAHSFQTNDTNWNIGASFTLN
jgi:autotransporter adhesin